MDDNRLEDIRLKIREMKELALHVQGVSADFPAVQCNVKRLLASLAMLELGTEIPESTGS
jgi:hypothetical protein